MRVWLWLCLMLMLGPVSGRTYAQEGASLNEVEALAAQGRIMEARETLETWWTTRFSTASRIDRQRGIWLRGKLTVDPSIAEMDYRRLILEFPGGPYSDDALVRLGLSAEVRGDLREAEGFFQDLIRSYPTSPRVPEAEDWVRSHEDAIAALPAAGSVQETDRGEAGSETMAGGSEEGRFCIQLGAFGSLDRARGLAVSLSSAGYEPRIVRTPGSGLARVRLGRFSNREGAEGLARELEEKGYTAILATDAHEEEKVGGYLRSDTRFPPGDEVY
jgi:hypothetical protein